jgi:hypothetical protein
LDAIKPPREFRAKTPLDSFDWCYRDAFCTHMTMMEAYRRIRQLTTKERQDAAAMLKELGYNFILETSKETV